MGDGELFLEWESPRRRKEKGGGRKTYLDHERFHGLPVEARQDVLEEDGIDVRLHLLEFGVFGMERKSRGRRLARLAGAGEEVEGEEFHPDLPRRAVPGLALLASARSRSLGTRWTWRGRRAMGAKARNICSWGAVARPIRTFRRCCQDLGWGAGEGKYEHIPHLTFASWIDEQRQRIMRR